MKIVSLFSGTGGLDRGFENAGFDISWANEYDKTIWQTYKNNFPKTDFDPRSIVDINPSDAPDCDGIIGGPPCQSWSEAGSLKGIDDKRGQLFFDFIRIIKDKQPKFFLAENVSGMLLGRHSEALKGIKELFKNAGIGYDLSFKMLNAADYNVPQDRKRVIFVGIRKDINLKVREEEQKKKDQKESRKKIKEQKLLEQEEQIKKDFERKKIKEWEDKFDEEQKIKFQEESIKEERIKQRERLRQVIEEQSDEQLQEELFSKLDSFEVDISKKN